MGTKHIYTFLSFDLGTKKSCSRTTHSALSPSFPDLLETKVTDRTFSPSFPDLLTTKLSLSLSLRIYTQQRALYPFLSRSALSRCALLGCCTSSLVPLLLHLDLRRCWCAISPQLLHQATLVVLGNYLEGAKSVLYKAFKCIDFLTSLFFPLWFPVRFLSCCWIMNFAAALLQFCWLQNFRLGRITLLDHKCRFFFLVSQCENLP